MWAFGVLNKFCGAFGAEYVWQSCWQRRRVNPPSDPPPPPPLYCVPGDRGGGGALSRHALACHSGYCTDACDSILSVRRALSMRPHLQLRVGEGYGPEVVYCVLRRRRRVRDPWFPVRGFALEDRRP